MCCTVLTFNAHYNPPTYTFYQFPILPLYLSIIYLSFLFQLFEFADKYRGKYDSSISVAQKYYRSVSGYAVRNYTFNLLLFTYLSLFINLISILVLSFVNFWIVEYEQDELLWAAAWLYKATNEQYYLNYLGDNGDNLGGTGWAMTEFGWDVKYAGVQTLVSMVKCLYNLNS